MCAFNRTVDKVDRFLANEAKGTKVMGARSLSEMVSKLKKPRRVMLLVKAGDAVDAFIEQLVGLMSIILAYYSMTDMPCTDNSDMINPSHIMFLKLTTVCMYWEMFGL